MHQGNKSLARERPKVISLLTMVKAHPLPEGPCPLDFLSPVQPACQPTHRWDTTRHPQLYRVDHRARALGQQARTASHGLHLHCLVHISSDTPRCLILNPYQHHVHHSHRDVCRMTRTGCLGLAHRLPYPVNPIRQINTKHTHLLFRRYRIITAKADEWCQVHSRTYKYNTLASEESLRPALPSLLHCAENNLANRLLREVKTRKAAQVTMMKMTEFK